VRVTMLVKSDVLHDARVRREAESLAAAGHEVTVIGEQRPAPQSRLDLAFDGVEIRWTKDRAAAVAATTARGRAPAFVRWAGLPWHRRRAIRQFQRRAAAICADQQPDVVHAHDFSALRVGAELAARTGARLVYDSHECWTGRRLEGRPEPLGRASDRRIERRLGTRADHVLTVSTGIADWMHQQYGWNHVTVVRNTFPVQGTRDRPAISAPPAGILYAGRVDAKRDLMTAVDGLRGHALALTVLGPADPVHLAQLAKLGCVAEPPLPIDDVDARYRAAGIALVPLTDDQLNHQLALPNKVFHAVRAGVPVVAADLPELRRIVTEHDLGELYTPGDPASLRAAVDRVLARHTSLLQSVADATTNLTWPHDEAALVNTYAQLEVIR
jgi:glycogen(starch) synthase